MSIKIDHITIDDPVFLAPMTGVSDLPFRRLVKRYGAGLVFSEMIASRAMVMEKRDAWRMAKGEPEEHPMAVQLAGCDPEVMAEAAKLNEDSGAAMIDINFGCPVKKVVKGYAGSALMRDEPLAAKILESVVKAVKIPVTLKMRMGWDHNSLNAPKMAQIAENAGIRMLTVHGRTRCQMYKGQADWAFIRHVKESTSLPVIANGDITDFDDVKMAMEQSGADGVMIGRGTYGRPWFVKQAIEYLKTGTPPPPPMVQEQKALVLEHYDAILDHYGVGTGVKIARKHLGWYVAGMHKAAEFRQLMNQQTDPAIVRQLTTDFYDQAAG